MRAAAHGSGLDFVLARTWNCMWACTPDVALDAAHPHGIVHFLADDELGGLNAGDVLAVSFYQSKFRTTLSECGAHNWFCERQDGPGVEAWRQRFCMAAIFPFRDALL